MSASFPVPDAAFRFLMDIRTPITPAQITRTAAGILTGRIPLKAFSEKITRYTKTEIKIKSTIPVAELQKEVDRLSKELRETDETIQGLNWTTELI